MLSPGALRFEYRKAFLERGPIGVFIGSKTPSEIAVRIMAEVIAVKNGVALARTHDVVPGWSNVGTGCSFAAQADRFPDAR